MLFISFDLGVKNMAFCEAMLQQNGKFSIQRFELHQMHTLDGHTSRTIDGTIQWLKDNFQAPLAHDITVLIESQMTKNNICYAQSFAIQTYFRCTFPTCRVEHVSPQIKPLPSGLHAKQRKGNKAKEETFELLDTHATNAQMCKTLISNTKKSDDLCDCVLQLFGYVDALPRGRKIAMLAKVAKQKTVEIICVDSDDDSDDGKGE